MIRLHDKNTNTGVQIKHIQKQNRVKVPLRSEALLLFDLMLCVAVLYLRIRRQEQYCHIEGGGPAQNDSRVLAGKIKYEKLAILHPLQRGYCRDEFAFRIHAKKYLSVIPSNTVLT